MTTEQYARRKLWEATGGLYAVMRNHTDMRDAREQVVRALTIMAHQVETGQKTASGIEIEQDDLIE